MIDEEFVITIVNMFIWDDYIVSGLAPAVAVGMDEGIPIGYIANMGSQGPTIGGM